MEQFLALNASAGSGKTYALTLRYISLLFLDINPSTILTLTFTNKAASEMNERIFKTLLNIGSDYSILDEISSQTNLQISEILTKKNKILEIFLTSEIFILTLDKFTNKILREFSGYIDVSDDFTIENDDYDLMLYKFLLSLKPQEFENLINFSHTNDKKLNAIIELFVLLDDKNEEFSIIDFQEEILLSLENEIMQCGYKIKEFILSANLSNSAINSVGFNSLNSLLDCGKTWLTKESLSEYSYFKKAKISSVLDDELHKIKQNLTTYFKYKEIGILNHLFSIFNNFKSFRYNYKKDKNSLQFNDITNLVYLLLQKYVDKDFLYFRLDAKYNHILIDEFQDTSVIQYKILEPLIEEILSGSCEDMKYKTFFYVGDTKQSIYRFRGGKKELFDFVLNKFDEVIRLQILDKNYRSSKNIVKFVNDIFLNIPNYEYHEQFVNSKIDGFVEVVGILNDENIDVADDKQAKFNFLKEKLNQLLQEGINPNNIAILTYTNNDVLEVYEYLKANFSDIKIVTDMTSKLTNQKNVKAIINLIKYFYFKADIYRANFNTLMGFDFLEEISFEVDLKDTDLVLLVKNIASYYQILEDNVLKFIENLTQYSDIVDFIYEIDKNDAVMINKENIGLQILTIFKSKGLEFDTVLLLDRMKNKNTDKSALLFSYDDVHLNKIYYKDKIREEFDLEYKKAIDEEKNQARNDELNVLYVSLTRAKYNLIVFKKTKQSVFEVFGDIGSKYKNGTLFLAPLNLLKTPVESNKIEYQPLYLGIQDLSRKDKTDDSDDIKARYFGLATHFCLEMMADFDEKSISFAAQLVRNKFAHILNGDEFIDMENRINNLVKNSLFLKLLEGSICKKEQSLIYENEVKIIDLLIKKDDFYTIVDYKTTSHQEDGHKRQVQNYMKYIENITYSKADGYLVYLQKDAIEVVKVL